MKRLISIAILISISGLALAFSEAPNRPYVQSGCDGIFYARCIPASNWNSEGTTEIFKVQKDQDQRIDHYDWYAREGVFIAWSPIAGKVAVLFKHQDDLKPSTQQVELSFYLGGQLLKSWNTSDLEKLGAHVSLTPHGNKRAKFRILGSEQIPRTNEYVFTIDISGKRQSFDILTGDIYKNEAEQGAAANP